MVFLTLCLALSLTHAPAADKPLAVPIEGDPFCGRLVSVDAGGLMVFDAEGGKRELAAGTLVRWGDCEEADRAPVFLLRDGTLLVGAILEAREKELALDSDCLGLVHVPRQQIAAVVLRLPASRFQRDRLLDEAVRSEEQTTGVVMLNGDRMRGQLTALSDRGVSLRTSVGSVELGFENISTITFPAISPGEPGGPSVVGLADGSRLRVKELVVDGAAATLQLAGGLSWKTEAKQIVFLQPASARLVYLSDLTPVGYRHVPYLERQWPYRPDRNVIGGLLRCGGRLYLKGLGLYTAARISYAPPENSARFQAALGIDDGTEGLGSVRFRVFVDGDQEYVSPTVRGLDGPLPVDVDVRGARRVDLVVDFADGADVQDLANWLDARFVLAK